MGQGADDLEMRWASTGDDGCTGPQQSVDRSDRYKLLAVANSVSKIKIPDTFTPEGIAASDLMRRMLSLTAQRLKVIADRVR